MLLYKSAEDFLLLQQRGLSKCQFPRAGAKLWKSSPGEGKLLGERKGVGVRDLQTCLRLKRRMKFVREGGKNHQLIGLWHLPKLTGTDRTLQYQVISLEGRQRITVSKAKRGEEKKMKKKN